MFKYLDELRANKSKDKKKLATIEKITTQEIFENIIKTNLNNVIRFEDFPNELSVDMFNLIAIENGMVGLYYDNELGFECCMVEEIGLPRKDGRPNKVIAKFIDNGRIYIKENLINDKDIVIYYYGSYGKADLNVSRFAKLLTEVDTSIIACLRHTRYNPLIRVKSDNEKKAIENAVNNTELGGITTYITENTFEELLNKNQEIVLNLTDVKNTDKLQYLEHFNNGLTARLYGMYGCSVNTNGKMAQLTEKEIDGRESSSFIIPLDMLRQAKEFCERANKLFNTNISAKFGEVLTHNYNSFCYDKECREDLKNVSRETLESVVDNGTETD